MAKAGELSAAGQWPRKWRRIAALAVLLVSVGLYLNTLSFGFTWDDQWLILDNYRLTEPRERWGYVKYMFTERALWRPIKRLSLMIDYSLYGRDATGFHATNIALEGAVCLALFAFARRLSGSDRVGFATAMLFAVHPIHVESIANISHRKEPLSLLFFLLGFLAYLRSRAPRGGQAPALEPFLGGAAPAGPAGAKPSTLRTSLYLGLVLFCYLCGMLSKDVGAVMLPVTIVVYELALRRPTMAEKVRRLLLLAAPALPVLLLFTLKGYIGSIPRRFKAEQILWITANQTDSYGRVFLGAVKAFWTYLHLFVWPWPLYLDRAFALPRSIAEWEVLAGFLSIGLYAFAIRWSWRSSRLAFFALLWYGLNLLPVINLVPLTHWLVAERFAYVPSVGMAILAAVALEALWQGRVRLLPGAEQKTAATVIFALILAGFGALTVWQNRVWSNSLSLWSHTLKYNQRSFRGLYGYGLEMANAGKTEEAVRYYERTIEVMPSYPEAHYALGLLYLNERRWADAIREATLHADLARKDPEPFIIIGNAHFGTQNYQQAAVAYYKAIQRKPTHMNARFNFANALYGAGNYEEALTAIDDTIKMSPESSYFLLRGNILEQLRQTDEALRSYRRAADLDPNSVDVANDLAQALIRQQRYPEAANELERSLTLKPNQPKMKALLERIKPYLP